MHVTVDVLARELAMLIALLALGAGPASFLGQRFNAAARIALAPVLGLAFGVCFFTNIWWLAAADKTYWLLPLVAIGSLAVAGQRSGWRVPRVDPKAVLGLALVCVVVAAPMTYTLHERLSTGPFAYEVYDADGYVAETDLAQHYSLPASANLKAPFANFEWALGNHSTGGIQNLDDTALAANMNELLGLTSSDTQSAFLIMFLLAGALGAFAAVRYVAPRAVWPAAFAGMLFAGSFFLQLVADGSQAGLSGLTVILPFACLGAEAIRDRRLTNLLLLGLFGAALQSLYPLIVPQAAITSALVLLWLLLRSVRARALSARVLGDVALRVGLVTVCAAVFDLVSFTRNVTYWKSIATGQFSLSGQPPYHLPLSVLPGWLLQTREFYSVVNPALAASSVPFPAYVVPALALAVIAFGLKKHKLALGLLPLFATAAALAYYTSTSRDCAYCVDRNLLPVAPLAIGLLGVGSAAIAAAAWRWLRFTGIAVVLLIGIVIAAHTVDERRIFANGAYFLDNQNRGVLAKLPRHSGPVEIEGYAETPQSAPGELPLIISLVNGYSGEQTSVPTTYNDNLGLAYLGGAQPLGVWFNPNYRYVLTRLGSIQTERKMLAYSDGIALEERTQPLDVTIIAGLQLALVRDDHTGTAWVQSPLLPLRLLVVGARPGPVWISLLLHPLSTLITPPQPGLVAFRRTSASDAYVCLRVDGSGDVRATSLTSEFAQTPAQPGPLPYSPSQPPHGLYVGGMAASEHGCSMSGRY